MGDNTDERGERGEGEEDLLNLKLSIIFPVGIIAFWFIHLLVITDVYRVGWWIFPIIFKYDFTIAVFLIFIWPGLFFIGTAIILDSVPDYLFAFTIIGSTIGVSIAFQHVVSLNAFKSLANSSISAGVLFILTVFSYRYTIRQNIRSALRSMRPVRHGNFVIEPHLVNVKWRPGLLSRNARHIPKKKLTEMFSGHAVVILKTYKETEYLSEPCDVGQLPESDFDLSMFTELDEDSDPYAEVGKINELLTKYTDVSTEFYPNASGKVEEGILIRFASIKADTIRESTMRILNKISYGNGDSSD